MSIKQQGGVFGRNPTFNDVTIEGQLTFDGDIDINSDLKVSGAVEATTLYASTSIAVGNPANYQATFYMPGANANYVQVANGMTGAGPINGILYGLDASGNGVLNKQGNGDLITTVAGVERLRILEAGTFDVSAANIAFDSGYGIDFSATSGTGTSELLDDYEEGESGALTMTPQTSGTITLNTNYDTFKYTKIGDRVTISGQFVVSSVSSPVGAKVTLPLPFTSASGVSKRAGTAAYYYTGGGVETLIPCGVSEGSTNLTIHLDASTIVAGHEFWFDVTYQAA